MARYHGHMDFTPETAAAYLSAMIDGEGCVEFKRRPNSKGWRRRVRITNTSPGIVAAVREACGVLDVHYTMHERTGTNKPAWEFNFPGSSIPLLAEVLTLADEGKRERLAQAAGYSVRWTRDERGRLQSCEAIGV